MQAITNTQFEAGSLWVSVAVAARRLGIAPATLRTWDRRYGLGPSQREGGSHRRYSVVDLARLDYMAALIRSGSSPAQAAAAALARTFTPEECAPIASRPATVIGGGAARGRIGGGNVVATPGGDRRARGLAKSASAIDQTACASIIDESLQEIGVIPTWEELLVPVLKSIGDMWELRECGIEVEHVLSTAVQVELSAFAFKTATQASRGTVLLGAVAGDDHQLPLWAVGAALAEQGIRFVHLGGGLPLESLGDVISRTGPSGVFLWSQLQGSADADRLAGLPSLRPNPRIVIGGPGWRNAPPRGVYVADSLGGAVALMSEIIAG
ncbi:MAG: MerR family transcriptional regulator [Candidatus Nanopelagicales bacterium]|nr:MerR family transcriptional regulator [Candidatus Nanopelagicales bacterium]